MPFAPGSADARGATATRDAPRRDRRGANAGTTRDAAARDDDIVVREGAASASQWLAGTTRTKINNAPTSEIMASSSEDERSRDDRGRSPRGGAAATSPNDEDDARADRKRALVTSALDEGARKRSRRMFAGLVGTLRRSAADEERAAASERGAQRRALVHEASAKDARRVLESALANLERAEKDRDSLAEEHARKSAEQGEARHCRAGGRGGRPVVWFAPKIHNDATREAAEKAREEQRARRGDALERAEKLVERLRRDVEASRKAVDNLASKTNPADDEADARGMDEDDRP